MIWWMKINIEKLIMKSYISINDYYLITKMLLKLNYTGFVVGGLLASLSACGLAVYFDGIPKRGFCFRKSLMESICYATASGCFMLIGSEQYVTPGFILRKFSFGKHCLNGFFIVAMMLGSTYYSYQAIKTFDKYSDELSNEE